MPSLSSHSRDATGDARTLGSGRWDGRCFPSALANPRSPRHAGTVVGKPARGIGTGTRARVVVVFDSRRIGLGGVPHLFLEVSTRTQRRRRKYSRQSLRVPVMSNPPCWGFFQANRAHPPRATVRSRRPRPSKLFCGTSTTPGSMRIPTRVQCGCWEPPSLSEW